MKTVETLPDGNQNVVYTNAYAEIMLSAFVNTTSGQQTLHYYNYDTSGRILYDVAPAAISSYSEALPDLVQFGSAIATYLNYHTGLVTSYAYNTSGYLVAINLQQGEFGNPVPQNGYGYGWVQNQIGGRVYLRTSSTVYPQGNSIQQTTQYVYALFPRTLQIQTTTTLYPTVSSAENGPGSGNGDFEVVINNQYGQPEWTKDADGFLTYTAHDVATGAVTEQVLDVDTNRSYPNLPQNWHTPTGGGLNLDTTYRIDNLGRPTAKFDPMGNRTFIVYLDAAHEVLTYPGWNSATNAPTGPTQVRRIDRAHSYNETLTMTAAPHLTGGLPDGTEAISGLQSLSRAYTNTAGQITETDDWVNLYNLTYNAAVRPGSPGTDYAVTHQDYDNRGWPSRTVSATGTITRTVHDGLGRAVSTWVGITDRVANGTTWSPTNPGGMVEVSAEIYDNGGVGDGNRTLHEDFPGGGAAPRLTEYYFDWRDRPVASAPALDTAVTFSIPGDVPITGDWNGNGRTEVGFYRPSTHTFYLDVTGEGVWNTGDASFTFGNAGDIPITGDWNGDGKTKIGVYRPSNHTFYLDTNGDGVFNSGDQSYTFGNPGDVPITGDWNGNGRSKVGIYRPSTQTFYLDSNGDGVWDSNDQSFTFGNPGDIPITGDWNGAGRTEIGIYRPSTQSMFYLDTTGDGTWNNGDQWFIFGNPGDVPITGDWNGSGTTKIGIFRPSTQTFYLDTNGDGAWDSGDSTSNFTVPGDVPLSGDWTGLHQSDVGLYRPATQTFYLDTNGNNVWDANDVSFTFGNPGDIPITGDWSGTGFTKIGVYRPSTHTFYLDYNGDDYWDAPDQSFTFGNPGDVPVTGDWNGDGKTKIGVYRPSNHTFYLDINGDGVWDSGDQSYTFGNPGDVPITGDWSGTGKSGIGVYRPGNQIFYLDTNGNGSWDSSDSASLFGAPGTTPIVGDWIGPAGSRTEIGLWNANTHTFYLDGDGSLQLALPGNRPLSYLTYDNNDHVTQSQLYDGLTTFVLNVNGVPSTPLASWLRGQSTSQYDAQGRPYRSTTFDVNQDSGVVAAGGRETDTWYDHRSEVAAVQTPDGLSTKATYDGAGRPTVQYITGSTNSTWATALSVAGDTVYSQVETTYDADSNPVEQITRRRESNATVVGPLTSEPQARVSYVASYFDALNRPIATLNAGTNNDQTWTPPPTPPTRPTAYLLTNVSYSYGSTSEATNTGTFTVAGLQVQTADPLGIVHLQQFDARGRLGIDIQAYTNGGIPGTDNDRVTLSTYDGDDHVLTQALLQPSGAQQQTQYVYAALRATGSNVDSNDLLTAVRLPDPSNGLASTARQTVAQADALGKVIAQTDADGHTTHLQYDSLGRLISTVNPLGAQSSIAYEVGGHVSATTDPDGRQVSYRFDSFGDLLSRTDALGRTTQYQYDSAGRVVTVLDPTQAPTVITYDALSRPTTATDALGHQTQTYYAANGQVVAQYDGNGNETSYSFDIFDRPVGTRDGNQQLTSTVLDQDGRVLSLTDAQHNTTAYSYNDLGAVLTMTDPRGPQVHYVYNGAGQVVTVTDRDGRVSQYTYDAAGRETGVTWSPSVGAPPSDTKTYTYDGADNLLSAANSAGTYNLTYNAANEVTHVSEPFGVSLDFTYDPAGLRTSVTDSLGGTTASNFDAAGELTSRQFSDGTTALRIDQTYDPRGLVQSQTRSANLAGTAVVADSGYTYDAAGELTHLQHVNAQGSNLANLQYTYDPGGRVLSEQLNGSVTNYQYDNADQVTAAGTQNYSYDAVGNRTSSGYTTGTGNVLLSDGTWNYSYDREGNLAQKSGVAGGTHAGETWQYGYNNANQLTDVQQSQGGVLEMHVEYKYDAFGNRVEKDLLQPTSTVERYAYDGWNPAKAGAAGNAGWDVWADLTGSSSLKTRYLDGDAVDQVFARIEKSGSTETPYWLLTDRLGSVRDVVANSGTIQDALNYDAYGNILPGETNAAARGRYAWTGRELDVETGLQYNRARYYDTTTGRWLTQDPLGFSAGDSNLYRYVQNQPTGGLDPSGLDSPFACMKMIKEAQAAKNPNIYLPSNGVFYLKVNALQSLVGKRLSKGPGALLVESVVYSDDWGQKLKQQKKWGTLCSCQFCAQGKAA